MKVINAVAIVVALFMIGNGAFALSRAKSARIEGRSVFEQIKSVPPGASIEYRINGQVAQSLTIPPGVYRISITQLH